MKRLFLSAAAALAVAAFASSPAAAQATTTQTAPAARDSVRVEISPELQRSLDELAATLDRLARRIANDPELRTSAVRAGQTFVEVAQVMVVQQAELLQEALKKASEELAKAVPAPATPQQRNH